MLRKFIIDVDENKSPAIIEWSDEKEDYVFTSMPKDMTRYQMIDLMEEVERITEWED